jgi:hypothetical protein
VYTLTKSPLRFLSKRALLFILYGLLNSNPLIKNVVKDYQIIDTSPAALKTSARGEGKPFRFYAIRYTEVYTVKLSCDLQLPLDTTKNI